MKLIHKSSLLVGLSGLGLIFSQNIQAENCALNWQNAYKSKENSTVYYVSRLCTKRPFPNEEVFFAYFSSWRQVKITTAKILDSIPLDPKGAMKTIVPKPPKKETIVTVINPPVSTPIIPETKIEPPPVVETKFQPIISFPIQLPAQTPIKPAVLSGVMADFLQCPTETERTQIEADFNLSWNHEWTALPYDCQYKSSAPSRLPIYATLRLLKNIQFSQPLPFTNGENLYSFLTNKKLNLIPSQNCAEYSTGGNYQINLGGIFAHLNPVRSGTANCAAAGASTNELLDGFVYNPIYKAGTFVHEVHHAIEASGHDGVNGGDKNINSNSAWAVQFYFYAWVNMYSTNVDPTTKILAKNAARDIIMNRFSENKCPADADLKKIINTIVPNTCV